jgi:hypothetical protein
MNSDGTVCKVGRHDALLLISVLRYRRHDPNTAGSGAAAGVAYEFGTGPVRDAARFNSSVALLRLRQCPRETKEQYRRVDRDLPARCL